MSKQRCEQLAKRLGAVITEPDYLRLEAPLGKTFNGDVHEQVYYYACGDKAGAWADMLADLRYMDKMGDFIACQKKFDFEPCEWCDEAMAKLTTSCESCSGKGFVKDIIAGTAMCFNCDGNGKAVA
jgi:hypothetical protein